MSKEPTKTLHVTSKFAIAHEDGSKSEFGPGVHQVPASVADHWMAKAHSTEVSSDFVAPAGSNPVSDAERAAFDAEKQEAIEHIKAEAERLEALRGALDKDRAAFVAEQTEAGNSIRAARDALDRERAAFEKSKPSK